jgi:hypothetical protein
MMAATAYHRSDAAVGAAAAAASAASGMFITCYDFVMETYHRCGFLSIFTTTMPKLSMVTKAPT